MSEYPRIYPVTTSYRVYARFTALLLVSVAVIGTVGQTMGWIRRTISPLGFVLVDSFFAVLAADIWLSAERTVTLRDDGIDLTTWRGTRSLNRSEILGRRFVWGGRYRSVHMYLIVPVDSHRKGMKLPPSLKIDHHFLSWMNTIPRLDA